MSHARLIYDDTPEFIPVPRELRHRKTEIIILTLEDEDVTPAVITAKDHESANQDQQWFNCDGEPVIAGQQCFPDLSEFHKTLPTQEMSAGEFCRKMRDEDRY